MQQTADKIIKQLIRYKNGVVSDSMIEKGTRYPMNYGVSVSNIAAIAKPYYPNHALAVELFCRPEREAKLAAFYIESPAELTEQQFVDWSLQFTNSEIVEQACLRLFPQVPFAEKYAMQWAADENEYLQKTAWMIIGRRATQHPVSESRLLHYFELFNAADLASKHVQRAIIYAFPAIANRYANLHPVIKQWANKQLKTDNDNLQYVINEIVAFI